VDVRADFVVADQGSERRLILHDPSTSTCSPRPGPARAPRPAENRRVGPAPPRYAPRMLACSHRGPVGRVRLLGALALPASILSACGSRTELLAGASLAAGGGTTSASSSSSTASSSSSASSSGEVDAGGGCPTTRPENRSPCPTEGLRCPIPFLCCGGGAICEGGQWSLSLPLCGLVCVACPENGSGCAPEAVCVERPSGDSSAPPTYSCEPDPCGSEPLSCACAASLCSGPCTSAGSSMVVCGTTTG
jgi:hypothetical protein